MKTYYLLKYSSVICLNFRQRCYCGDDPGSIEDDIKCSYGCKGNNSFTCGDGSYYKRSVYSTGL